MKTDRRQIFIFTEIGFGNPSFISTEIEKFTREKRVRGFVRFKLQSIYLRFWIGYNVLILSPRGGFEIKRKPKRKFKILLGLYGHGIDKKK